MRSVILKFVLCFGYAIFATTGCHFVRSDNLNQAIVCGETEAVRKAMIAAKEAGSPLTVSQWLNLLNDQGVQIPELLSRLLRGISAR